MFAKETEKKIDEIIQAEYENAKEKWGDRYSNQHEGFAVLLEEVEEARREYKAMKFCVKALWNDIMQGYSPQVIQKQILDAARKLAMEACQVAAVCKKMLDGVER